MRYSKLSLTGLMIITLAGCASVGDAPIQVDDAQIAHPWHAPPGASDVRTVPRPVDPSSVDRVFVHCGVTQGNGFNWAATMGWLSGEVHRMAEAAARYEQDNPGRHAAVDLSCLTGSSSGSAMAALLDHLLANEKLVSPDSGDERLLTPEQARQVSEALLFLALSADFGTEKLALGFTAIGAYFGWLDRASRAEPVSLWRSKSTAARNTKIFGKWIRAARNYDPAWFDEITAGEALAIPTFAQRPNALDFPEGHPADKRMAALARDAFHIVDQRGGRGPIVFEPVGDGFCVTALAVPLDRNKPPFELDRLVLIYACNGDTEQSLTSSLAPLLAGGRAMGTRLRLASADAWATLLNLSTREADLVTPLSGRLLEPPIGLDTARAFDGSELVPTAPEEPFVVLGGFAGPRLQAWAGAALLHARLAAWEARGIEAEGRLTLFGRPEVRDDATSSFAQRTVTTYFAPDADPKDKTPSATLMDFYAWQDEFCDVADDIRSDTLSVEYFRMDWNLKGAPPAALAGRSRELAALGFNTSQHQRPDGTTGNAPRYLFAPEDTLDYVPDAPATGMACRLDDPS
jgi:hypothetical protein